MSVHGDLLSYCVTQIQSLTLAAETANIKARGLPVAREQLDAVPAVLVSTAQKGERTARDSTEGTQGVEYPVQIVLVSAVNADLSVPQAVLNDRQTIRRLFEDKVGSTSPSFWDVEVDPDPPLDRRRLSQHYAYSPMIVTFKTHEA